MLLCCSEAQALRLIQTHCMNSGKLRCRKHFRCWLGCPIYVVGTQKSYTAPGKSNATNVLDLGRAHLGNMRARLGVPYINAHRVLKHRWLSTMRPRSCPPRLTKHGFGLFLLSLLGTCGPLSLSFIVLDVGQFLPLFSRISSLQPVILASQSTKGWWNSVLWWSILDIVALCHHSLPLALFRDIAGWGWLRDYESATAQVKGTRQCWYWLKRRGSRRAWLTRIAGTQSIGKTVAYRRLKKGDKHC